MTAKQLRALIERAGFAPGDFADDEPMLLALAPLIERRGEERVLRYYGMTRREYEGSLDRARKARRARGGAR